ncbi:MAG: LysM domain-containing protein [Alphaproteobacteria bacterium]|jgi:LysM repeat protein|nr:LysM domain-containing protein [Alphaproteobacteria bacterium]
MIEKNIEEEKKRKFLTVALSISIAFNVALLINFSFLVFKQEIPKIETIYKDATEIVQAIPALESLLNQLLEKPMAELIPILSDQTILEEGYKARDLALAVLAGYHYFDLEKAISGVTLEKRVVHFEKKDSGEQFELILFPGLVDEHFFAINQYLKSEKWPFTPEGIFFELKKHLGPSDLSLREAFYKTQHFELIELLMKRNNLSPSREIILRILLLDDFQRIDHLVQKILKKSSFPKEFLQNLLQEAILKGSAQAATLFVELDANYLLKNLEDKDLLPIIKNLKTRTDRTLYFLKELTRSIRTDAIRKEAALKLYALYKDSLPESKNQKDILKKLTAKVEDHSTSGHSFIIHIVKEGETLWQIARKYKVPIKEIVEKNKIDKTKPLQIGATVYVPKNSDATF